MKTWKTILNGRYAIPGDSSPLLEFYYPASLVGDGDASQSVAMRLTLEVSEFLAGNRSRPAWLLDMEVILDSGHLPYCENLGYCSALMACDGTTIVAFGPEIIGEDGYRETDETAEARKRRDDLILYLAGRDA